MGIINKFKLNFLFGIFNSIISALQTFWLIPYVKEYLGSSAYGYISVVNGLVNVLLVISTAVASMGTRFILVNLESKKYKDANIYFNSELIAMILSGIVISIIGLILTFNLNILMNINSLFYHDVQILFMLTILSFVIQLLSSPFSASFFYKNSLYITYIIYMCDYVGRILLTIFMYRTGHVVLWSAILATDIVYTLGFIFYVLYSKKNIPNLIVKKSYFNIKYLFELIASGTWIAVSSAGNMLLSSLNTYLSNIFCGVFITGIYAAITQFNIIESTLLGVLVNTLLPRMFKLFSSKRQNDFTKYTINSMLLSSLFLSVVSGGIIIFGNDFMRIWMGEKFTGYEILIIITTIYLPITLPSQVLNQSFTVMNKVKLPALATIFFGLLTLMFAYIFTRVFHFGIYGIATATMLSQILRDNFFYPFYFSRLVQSFRKYQLLPIMIAIIGVIGSTIICFCVRNFIIPQSLIKFILDVLIGGGSSLGFIYLVYWKAKL